MAARNLASGEAAVNARKAVGRASRAGDFHHAVNITFRTMRWPQMPRGRSTFNKRRKEQQRQQRQRDKVERKILRKEAQG